LTGFGVGFWKDALWERGYTVVEERLDLETLAKQRVVPSSHLVKGRDSPSLMEAILFYRDRYVEAAALVYDRLPSRGVCVRVARQWRENRLYRPLLIFTDGESCYAVIVRGAGLDGEARVLHLEDRLYRTDLEVLESIKHPGTPEELRRKYDEEFFPYEKVRDEFFNRYRELYEKVVAATRRVIGEKRAKEYAQRFLGRLMFIYFLQRKGWLNNDKNYIDKIADYRALNDLFYNKLNKEDGDGIPYLNGSLFEREDYIEELETKAGHKLDEIFKEARKLFNNYNFTVDETSPLEVEVSVDPLLLGTVLENMLPEHERGEKGTFYTPVNEIGFICRKALAAWLGVEDRVEKDKLVDGLQEYIEGLKRRRDEREIREFREKLLSVKVCDPAVGSGGFLVVMMQTILSLIQEVEEAVGWRADPAIYKARILTNLYGFDIEPEAVEIARLRLWLSLIIDQKRPEPLPNLDLNITVTSDSLTIPKGKEVMAHQLLLDQQYTERVEHLMELKKRYVVEHDPREKTNLRTRIEKIQRELVELAAAEVTKGLHLELLLMTQPDVVVMNPPYVRQEKINPKAKKHYVEAYSLDRTSDIYAYFMVRALKLLKDGGAAAIISSDKWLEVGYGLKLQERLKPHILAVYGQRMRSFTADVNTVITVLKKVKLPDDHPIQFIYLNRYGGDEVINHKSIPRGKLNPGKWYYLRAPKIFEEKLLPKLNRRLREFADIKRGFTTGANEFFYMKDITHLYEADYLANPKKFEEWGVKAKTGKELVEQGLIYIENEGGERFVINREDVKPLVRSPKQIRSYVFDRIHTLVLYTRNPGKFTTKYIRWGERQGYNERPTCKARRPWYALPELDPANILLPMSWMSTIYIPYCMEMVLCDHRLYIAKIKNNISPQKIWFYLNSTLFYVTVELVCRRLGGGATDIMVEDYEMVPTPDLSDININLGENILRRPPKPYYDEVKEPDRRELDKAVLRALGFPEHELDALVDELHKAFVWVVEDRLIKAGRPLQVLEEKEYGEDN
jgi:type I restriction-modification system DNA methylase subunit